MKTKTINLYTYNELEPKAKEKALSDWRDDNDFFFLSDYLNNCLHELLEENGIKDDNDTSKPGTKPTPVLYSLSYCQGDGAMFEGSFTWNGYSVTVKHVGRYYHYNSKNIEMFKIDDEGADVSSDIIIQFESIYKDICKELERNGYDFMECENSEETFISACEANEYTFLSNGKMENE
jgi:hypothetical protein